MVLKDFISVGSDFASRHSPPKSTASFPEKTLCIHRRKPTLTNFPRQWGPRRHLLQTLSPTRLPQISSAPKPSCRWTRRRAHGGGRRPLGEVCAVKVRIPHFFFPKFFHLSSLTFSSPG
jgi:hypothetical protein